MRLRDLFTFRRDRTGLIEAKEAAEDAERHLIKARARAVQVWYESNWARTTRETNHLTERFRQGLGGHS